MTVIETPPALPEELAPEPADAGALIGYARVSAKGAEPRRPDRALTEAGCLRIFAGKLSGKDAARPEMAACLDYLRPGDTLVVTRLDRLSRSLQDHRRRRRSAPPRRRVPVPARGAG